MTTYKQRQTIKRGFTVTIDGVPSPINSRPIRMGFRKISGSQALFVLSVGNGLAIVDDAAGKVEYTISSSNSELLPVGDITGDAEFIDGGEVLITRSDTFKIVEADTPKQ